MTVDPRVRGVDEILFEVVVIELTQRRRESARVNGVNALRQNVRTQLTTRRKRTINQQLIDPLIRTMQMVSESYRKMCD